jgi:peptide/nickel transport system permease protein
MLTLIARRLAFLVLVVFGVTVITFVIANAVPGDPARLMAGPRATPEQVAATRAQLGLDRLTSAACCRATWVLPA